MFNSQLISGAAVSTPDGFQAREVKGEPSPLAAKQQAVPCKGMTAAGP